MRKYLFILLLICSFRAVAQEQHLAELTVTSGGKYALMIDSLLRGGVHTGVADTITRNQIDVLKRRVGMWVITLNNSGSDGVKTVWELIGTPLGNNGSNWSPVSFGITGTGTTNYLPKYTGASTLAISGLYEGINFLGYGYTTAPPLSSKFGVNGSGYFNGNLTSSANISGSNLTAGSGISTPYLAIGNSVNLFSVSIQAPSISANRTDTIPNKSGTFAYIPRATGINTDSVQVWRNDVPYKVAQSSIAGGGGMVSSVSSANTDISVVTGTTTPVLTLNSGSGANQIVKRDGSGNLNATTVTTNANLTGDVTSVGNATTYSGVLPSSKGGAGSLTGILKANGGGVVSAATSGTDYQSPITLTTTGTSGVATLVAGTLNIPNYAGGSSITYTPDASTISLSKSYLNTNYSTYQIGWAVIVSATNLMYIKVDNSSTGNWNEVAYNQVP